MKTYFGYLSSFILGGIIFGYLIFNYQARLLMGFADLNVINSHTYHGKQSIRVIKNIKDGDFKKAISELEQNIAVAKTTLRNIDPCSVEEKDIKIISEYKFIELTNNEANP